MLMDFVYGSTLNNDNNLIFSLLTNQTVTRDLTRDLTDRGRPASCVNGIYYRGATRFNLSQNSLVALHELLERLDIMIMIMPVLRHRLRQHYDVGRHLRL